MVFLYVYIDSAARERANYGFDFRNDDTLAGGGAQSKSVKSAGARLFSNSSRARFRLIPPPYPVSFPLAPITRWHGTMMAMGLWPLANPTARAAPGAPIWSAISP